MMTKKYEVWSDFHQNSLLDAKEQGPLKLNEGITNKNSKYNSYTVLSLDFMFTWESNKQTIGYWATAYYVNTVFMILFR